MKKTSLVIASIVIGLGLSGCFNDSEENKKILTLEQREVKAQQELERVLKEIDQIKQERQKERSIKAKKEVEQPTTNKQALENYLNKLAEASRKSESSKKLDINNNE